MIQVEESTVFHIACTPVFMKKNLNLLPLFLLFNTVVFGQNNQPDTLHRLIIQRSTGSMHLDGRLDEAAWQLADVADGFHQNFPFDSTLATLQTEVRVTFDDAFLYVGAIVYQPQSDYIITSLKRDFAPGPTDVFMVNFDPFKDKLNGFHFAVSPYNVQREGLIDNGSTLTRDWDNKWYSQVKNHPDHWVVEMAIPFKTLRYKRVEGQNTWRINFSRNSVKQNEQSTWSRIPRQFGINNIAFSGLLIWKDAPPSPGLNISVIPYLSGRMDRDQEFKLPTEYKANGGFDSKIAVTPSLNLDLTINPDFSQVEVDQQITNLSRFELFFPERRQFFLENEDLFAKFGFPNSRPFFSRRIGLASGKIRKTTTDGQVIEVNRTVNVPIIAGARLNGKLDDNWRIGLLNMHTAKVSDINAHPANYSVGVLQRKVFDRSYVGAVFANKENFVPDGDGGYQLDKGGYNRIAGLEYNLFSKDNKWEAEIFYHRSFSAASNEDAQSAAIFIGHYTRHFNIFFPTQYVGKDFRADLGFVPRPGFYSINPGISYNIFPKKKWLADRVINFYLGVDNELVYNLSPEFQLTDRSQNVYFGAVFNGQSEASIGYTNSYIYLFFPFDPTNTDGEQLPQGSDYTNNNYRFNFNSDLRKDFYFDIQYTGGEYFNGHINRVEGSVNYRWQPYGILAVGYAYNDIDLPLPYNSASFWLIGPKAELSFSKNLFLSTFLQYNTQANNVNINARLQWRYKPVSDLFLVYTDNYFSDDFFQSPRAKNRALVLKVTYWLNL